MNCYLLSPGQTELEIAASSGKLYLRRDLRWLAKRTRKVPLKYTHILSFIG